MDELQRIILGQNPYDGFPYSEFEQNVQGWGGNHPHFQELIDEVHPELIFEVGTWLGQSAINMATHIKRRGLSTRLICIDTWLGGLDHHWTTLKKDLLLINGLPSIYYHFLANVMYAGVEDVIVPFPTTSVIAARFLYRAGLKADLIYVDASHEYLDAKLDIEHYLPLLRNESSIIFGHDYDPGWPGVVKAVDETAAAYGKRIETHGALWQYR